MKMLRLAPAAAILILALYFPGRTPGAVVPAVAPVQSGSFGHAWPSRLSVMTYNVKGLPWPIAFGRSAALAEIGRRLARLRLRGEQPHIVLLQEAFTPEAKALGAMGGYRYAAIGPQPQDASPEPTKALGDRFRERAQWDKGENEGKWQDSGLVILSDYPIVASAKMAFPQDACAGFDCLATKGVVLARIRVPGSAKPVTFIDTHLNSRHASGVSIERANKAYAWQVDAVRRFVARQVDAEDTVIFGGDFNEGHDPDRLAIANRNGGFIRGGQEVVATIDHRTHGMADTPADLVTVRDRAKGKEYFRPARDTQMELRDIVVPFGKDTGGLDLSDHLGFVATYDL